MSNDVFHKASYTLGVEVGLQTALCCKDRAEIRAALDLVHQSQKRRIPNGEAEWQAWMVELEMQLWERDRKASAAEIVAAHREGRT